MHHLAGAHRALRGQFAFAAVSDPQVTAVAERLHDELQKAGIDVLYDDRDERPGVKFKDADLIGMPYRITVGKKGVARA